MKMQTVVATAMVLAGCSGGRWVDAPRACNELGRGIQSVYESAQQTLNGLAELKPSNSDDLQVVLTELLAHMPKAGVSEEDQRKAKDAFEQTIAQPARAICGNVGLSYTGEWECTAKVQRIRCK